MLLKISTWRYSLPEQSLLSQHSPRRTRRDLQTMAWRWPKRERAEKWIQVNTQNTALLARQPATAIRNILYCYSNQHFSEEQNPGCRNLRHTPYMNLFLKNQDKRKTHRHNLRISLESRSKPHSSKSIPLFFIITNESSSLLYQILWPSLSQKSDYPPLPISPLHVLSCRLSMQNTCSADFCYSEFDTTVPGRVFIFIAAPAENQIISWMENEVWIKRTNQVLPFCKTHPHQAIACREPSHYWAENLHGTTVCHGETAFSICDNKKPQTYLVLQSTGRWERFL